MLSLKRRLKRKVITDTYTDESRGKVWQLISGGQELLSANPGIYQLLLSTEISDSLENLIMKDIHRTLPSQELFQTIEGPGQRSLHNLLKAYAVYDTDVGYTQGMNFIAAIILLHMKEEEAFWVMVALLKGTVNMPIRGLYLEGLPLLQDYLNEFAMLVNEQLPELGRHFEEQMITPYMYASGWFMTLFSAYLPFPFTLRIWDALFSEGLQKTLFRVGLALLKHFEDDLLNLPFEELLQFLLHLPEEINLDLDLLLLPIAKVPTSEKRNYWEEQKLAWRSLL